MTNYVEFAHDALVDALAAANERISSLEVVIKDFAQIERGMEEALTAEREVSDKLEKALNDIAWLRHPGVAASEPVKRMESMAISALAKVAAIRKGEKQ